MTMWSMTLMLMTLPVSADEIGRTLDEVAPYRSMRLGTDAPPVPLDAYRQAAAGTPVTGVHQVEGVDASIGWGVAVYDQPIAQVWKAINDQDHMAEMTPVSCSLVVEGQARRDGRRVFEYLPISLFTDRWWVVELSHNAALFTASGQRLWELVWHDALDTELSGPSAQMASEGMPVKWARGGWLLIELDDGRTLGEYHTWTHPGGSVPVRLASSLAGRAVKRTLVAMGELAARMGQAHDFVRPDQSPL